MPFDPRKKSKIEHQLLDPEAASFPREKHPKGKMANEIPLSWRLQSSVSQSVLNEDYLSGLSQRVAEALRCIISNIGYCQMLALGAWIFYSRDKNHYALANAQNLPPPEFYTHHAICTAIRILEEAGLIDHIKTAPSPNAELRSKFRATPKLLILFPQLTVSSYKRRDGATIVLRDREKRCLPFQMRQKHSRIDRDVRAQNAFLAQFVITLPHSDVRQERSGLLIIEDRLVVDPTRTAYHRVFTGNFSNGGRWYGPFWQGLSKHIRQGLRIDGEFTVEVDYNCCHPRLLAALGGLSLPFDDPAFDFYTIPGWDRKLTKLAFNIMLNARTDGAAHSALAQELRDKGYPDAGPMARRLMTAIQAQYPGLEPFWCTGIGLKLQCHDATICQRVQRRLREQNIPALSVHDSFIVPVSHESRLKQVMDEEMDRMINSLNRNTQRRKSGQSFFNRSNL